MKNKTILISILLMLAAISLAACGPVAASSGAVEPRTVSVNGTGTIIVSPDMATVQVGVVK